MTDRLARGLDALDRELVTVDWSEVERRITAAARRQAQAGAVAPTVPEPTRSAVEIVPLRAYVPPDRPARPERAVPRRRPVLVAAAIVVVAALTTLSVIALRPDHTTVSAVPPGLTVVSATDPGAPCPDLGLADPVALTGTLGDGICIGTRTTARGSIEVVVAIDGLERDSMLFVPGLPGVTTDDPDCPWRPDWTLPRGGGTGPYGAGPAVQTAVAPAAVEYLALRPDATEVARAVHVPGVPGVSVFAVRLGPDVMSGALFLGDLIDAHGDAFTQQRCPRAGG